MPAAVKMSLRARLEPSLEHAETIEGVAEALFRALDVEIPNALVCLATVDPGSGLITRALKSRPLEIGDHEFAAAEYGAPDLNQFPELAARPVPVGVLSVDTGGRPMSCRRFREFMAPRFGFVDELRVACRVGSTMWGAFALYRGEGEALFTRQDGAVAAEAHAVVGAALMRTLVGPAPGSGAERAPVVLVLDDGDEIQSCSGPVEELVDALGGRDAGQLPAPVLAAAASARTEGGAVGTQIRTVAGDWVAARAVPVTTSSGVRSVVLTVDPPRPAAIGRLRLAAHGLTGREQEIVQQVLLGASTQEIALELHLSAHTVQDHLKAVFAKLGIRSRRELIAQFVG